MSCAAGAVGGTRAAAPACAAPGRTVDTVFLRPIRPASSAAAGYKVRSQFRYAAICSLVRVIGNSRAALADGHRQRRARRNISQGSGHDTSAPATSSLSSRAATAADD